ncbi:MAG: sensor domain-containing diguanylate cyclase [Enterobacterales bacterium]|nr:sensor domain-containing diguanylate cyclase [Enterobacterales bacterium]
MSDQIVNLQNEIALLQKGQLQYEKKLQELQQRSDIHYALNEILQLSLIPLSLNETLDRILILLLDIPWLALNRKGSVFLKTDGKDSLDLVVEYNLGAELQVKCKKVKFGTCLCGKAAQTQQIVFKDCVDHEHHHRPQGITPHGHYCIPIKGRNKLLGVLNLYVEHGHQSTSLEREFLLATTHVIAGTIERKRLEEQLIEHSFRDELTGLPNRRHFYDSLNRALASAKRHHSTIALFFMDLNNFKQVNDQYGHKVGDELLRLAASRMEKCIRASDSLARIGGDEFLILLEPTGSCEHIEVIAKNLKNTMLKPFVINNSVIKVGLSIGTSIYPQDGDSADQLLQAADNMMYQDKSGHSND